MKKQLLASIIISSYNYGRSLKDCIDSALNQTYPYTEVIVVNDASTDDSQKIIAGYGDRIIPVLREKNEGAKSTCNAACRLRPRLGGPDLFAKRLGSAPAAADISPCMGQRIVSDGLSAGAGLSEGAASVRAATSYARK